MRFKIVFAILLMIAPIGIRAEQPVTSSSSNQPCSIPADSHWEPQERFVWEHLCAGESADFNDAPGYDGHVDPKKPEGWTDNRRALRSDFLKEILLKEPYRSALTHIGVVIIGARFTDEIKLADLELQHPFRLQSSLFEKDINLSRVRSKNRISFDGSNFMSKLDMVELNIDGSLSIRDAKLARVNLTGAYIGGEFNLDGTEVLGPIDMSQIQVKLTLMMSNGVTFDHINLAGARIGGQVNLTDSRVRGTLYMNQIQVRLDLVLNDTPSPTDKTVFGDITLDNARLGANLVLVSSKVAGKLDCDAVQVDGYVRFAGTIFDHPIDCSRAKIKGDLILDKGIFNANVNFPKAEIGGSLTIDGVEWAGVTQDCSAALVTCTSLNLRQATIGTIPGPTPDDWSPALDINGLTYRSVGDANDYENWFRKLIEYSPQPYEQLATVIQNQGNSTLATAIRYAGRERERKEATGWWWAWLTLLKYLIDYGYYPRRPLYWIVGLVTGGMMVLRLSGEGRREGMPFGIFYSVDMLFYSVDMLLPIVQLRKRHYDIDLQTWARYYFYVLKIMGYVLASFLVAGLSGLTK